MARAAHDPIYHAASLKTGAGRRAGRAGGLITIPPI